MRNIRTCISIVSVMLLAAACSRSYLFFPDKNVFYLPESLGIKYVDVWFAADDGVKLNGWFAVSPKNRGTILFCHGNGGNISSYIEQLRIFTELGFNVLTFDYRGYGKSGGEPTVEGTYRDAAAAWRFLTVEKNIAPHTIILWGRSLGGPISAHQAAAVECGAYVAESSFASLSSEMSDTCCIAPFILFPGSDYPTIDFIKKIKCPILIIHSSDDATIPFHHGRELYDAAGGEKSFLEIRGTHNGGFFISRDVFIRGTDEFMKKYFDGRCTP